MTIVKFESGHWYRCVLTARGPGWNRQGEMDFILDHKPHLCTAASTGADRVTGNSRFSDDPSRNMWTWRLDEFDEVPISELKDSLTKEQYENFYWE